MDHPCLLYHSYTSFNSPRVYAPANQATPSQEMTWSAVALGGAVSTLIMIFATLAEFSYIPTTWNNRLILLHVSSSSLSSSLLRLDPLSISPIPTCSTHLLQFLSYHFSRINSWFTCHSRRWSGPKPKDSWRGSITAGSIQGYRGFPSAGTKIGSHLQ